MALSHAETWRVRILDTRGQPVGAGVLLPGGRVLTCAHVAEAAFDEAAFDEAEGGAADGPVGAEYLENAELTVDFPGSLAPRGGPVRAGIAPLGWAPPDGERADVAVLELRERAPDDCAPAVLRPCGAAGDRIVRAFGHPAGGSAGLWVRARLVGAGGLSPEWVQLEAAGEAGDRLRQGYSGAGVVDATGAVIGLVVAADTRAERRTGWMIPVEAAVRYCPGVADAVAADQDPAPDPGESAGTNGRHSADRRQAAGADALPPPWPPTAERDLARVLVKVRSFADAHRRERVLRDTGDDIAFHVERTGILINDARAVVGLCLEYEDGIDRLAAALRWYEPGSLPMREFDRAIARLRPRDSGGGIAP
ncbi:trypsin-like peptidase domain-containing protein [Streptomyces sp. NPDC059534]|uniref:effector-associated domain 2-containing protein n=1 Tax=Streptomyces sp. NPDC059534 TaxID=3346859 RepID=UPI00368D4839